MESQQAKCKDFNEYAKSANSQFHMPALTGIRFFAIFHIFLYHLWVLYDMDLSGTPYENLMAGFKDLPDLLTRYLSHGWLSTSFFFLLSGFILSALYWNNEGRLNCSKKKFFVLRASRIYPIHIIIFLLTLPMVVPHHLSMGTPAWLLVGSGVTTVTLFQAWVPEFIPIWSWPTWTLSALIFLYLMMPYLMQWLARCSRKTMICLLCIMPLLALLPSIVNAFIYPAGVELPKTWKFILSYSPIFWLPHFIAGMLLARINRISRFTNQALKQQRSWVSIGDVAFVLVIIVACLPGIEAEPYMYLFRHGLLMPLYMFIVLDFARGNGIFARLFSLPGTGFLGETGFSIFIWQNFVMILCWGSLMGDPELGQHHLWAASIGIIVLAIVSTYLIEKPLARKIRKKITYE